MKQKPQILTSIRYSEAILERIDKLRKRMTVPGMPPTTRAEVFRLATVKGIESLEAEQKKR